MNNILKTWGKKFENISVIVILKAQAHKGTRHDFKNKEQDTRKLF